MEHAHRLDMRRLRTVFLVVDLGFVGYWLCAWLQLFPEDWLFKDYQNPILQAWNFSFLPLDLLVSASGLSAVVCHGRGNPAWYALSLASLVLTSCSGLQALSFWALRGDFDPSWWLPNLFLLLYPLYFLAPWLRAELCLPR
jgi:hypothetical protein